MAALREDISHAEVTVQLRVQIQHQQSITTRIGNGYSAIRVGVSEAWLDFAYFFKKKLIDVPSSRRRHYQILQNVLADPIRTNNLSFAQYVNDQLDVMNNFINNKVININPPGCYCHAKCIGKEGSLLKLYSAGLFVLCKTCNRPVNYNHKLFRSVSIVNDPNNSTNYFACSDSCSEFENVDLHECSLNDDHTIYFRHKALVNISRKQKFVTSLCLKNRTCLNIVTVPAKEKLSLNCAANHNSCDETCFANLKFMIQEQRTIDIHLIRKEMCVGCMAFCFDICTRRDPVKTLVRSITACDWETALTNERRESVSRDVTSEYKSGCRGGHST